MDSTRAYWVTFSGALTDGGEVVDRSAGEADGNEEFCGFFKELTKFLMSDGDATGPAVLTYSDGSIVLAAVVRAASEGAAVDSARAVFTKAISRAGGSSDFPDDKHRSWSVARLLRRATVEAVEVVEAA